MTVEAAHTPSIAFWHLAPKKDGVNQSLEFGSSLASKYARKHETHPPRVKKIKKEFRLDSNDCGFICAGVHFVGGYK